MNKSRDNFGEQLEHERVLESARQAPSDPHLAADWRLRDELRGLGAADLPAGVRERALRAAARRDRAPWFMAAAAALVAAVVIMLVMPDPAVSPDPARPTERDIAELRLAINTISATGRHAVALAGREVSESLVMPELGLGELPYAGYVRPLFEISDNRSSVPKANTP